jgi:chorismate mutase/prephenate dehydratase
MDEARLKELRKRIDAIDNNILDLLAERLEVAREIGQAKGNNPVYDPEREEMVLSRLRSRVPDWDRDALDSIYEAIIGMCRSAQER